MATLTATFDTDGTWSFNPGNLVLTASDTITLALVAQSGTIAFLDGNPLSWFNPNDSNQPIDKPGNFSYPSNVTGSSLLITDTVGILTSPQAFTFRINALYQSSPTDNGVVVQSPDPTIINVDTGGVLPIIPASAQGTTAVAH